MMSTEPIPAPSLLSVLAEMSVTIHNSTFSFPPSFVAGWDNVRRGCARGHCGGGVTVSAPTEPRTLDDLEAIAFEHADQGVSILASQSPTGEPIWSLTVRIGTREKTYRVAREDVA